MREYKPKDNVQKKAYYTDRFWVAPKIPHESLEAYSAFTEDVEAVKKEVSVLDAYVERGQLVVIVASVHNVMALQALKNAGYAMLSEMSALDFLAQEGKFEVFYQLLNLKGARRARVKCKIDENEAIETVSTLYHSADWSERECFDMFGIKFNNHPNLKRILMPEDWEGFPLRKTYPLQGDEFAAWYEVDKIFGKEYRDVVGPEIRDSAAVDRYDSTRFARIGKEVAYGANPEIADRAQSELVYEYDKNNLLVEKFQAPVTQLTKRK
jgi:NADH-quinone oxidoreductase subunit C